ncbi:MAG TPA: hypothetical protein VMW69_00945 [Spirochaetia bacterium]|nr:hypothetical protein [Spirochaetia bacterium]
MRANRPGRGLGEPGHLNVHSTQKLEVVITLAREMIFESASHNLEKLFECRIEVVELIRQTLGALGRGKPCTLFYFCEGFFNPMRLHA